VNRLTNLYLRLQIRHWLLHCLTGNGGLGDPFSAAA
jgi:hypothetical protein